MLILSRKSNESIVIGGNIRITVASVRGRYVRLGIEAPADVKIFREELCAGREADAESTTLEHAPSNKLGMVHRSSAYVEAVNLEA